MHEIVEEHPLGHFDLEKIALEEDGQQGVAETESRLVGGFPAGAGAVGVDFVDGFREFEDDIRGGAAPLFGPPDHEGQQIHLRHAKVLLKDQNKKWEWTER